MVTSSVIPADRSRSPGTGPRWRGRCRRAAGLSLREQPSRRAQHAAGHRYVTLPTTSAFGTRPDQVSTASRPAARSQVASSSNNGLGSGAVFCSVPSAGTGARRRTGAGPWSCRRWRPRGVGRLSRCQVRVPQSATSDGTSGTARSCRLSRGRDSPTIRPGRSRRGARLQARGARLNRRHSSPGPGRAVDSFHAI